ncbi:MAG: septum formation initiator family protein [Planctomycetota bacterium]|nr:septum formation initiator family protein [Planctomycetota bacterium]MDI6787326.1 septum formation initiator family protein [Planctomycetota bacterium]
MYKYQIGPKNNWSGWWNLFWVFISATIITFLLTTSISAYRKNTILKNYSLLMSKEIADIAQENEILKMQIKSISDDPIYQEAIIRKEFKMCLPGEIIIKDSN